jgi:outer membrane scaffolding protein for murein synthesis (MipA/OmpV family)
MKKTIFFLLITLTLCAQNPKGGIGYFNGSSLYKGGEDIIGPVFNLSYGNLDIQGSEIYYKTINEEGISIGTYLEYDVTKGFENGDLKGTYSMIEEKKHPFIVGLKATKKYYNFDVNAKIYRDFNSSSTNASMELFYTQKIYEFLYFIPSIRFNFNDEKYTNKYFGISEVDSHNLGINHYKLNKSTNTKFSLGVALFFSKNLGSYFDYGIEKLDKDIDSIILKDNSIESFSASIFYIF